MNVETNAKGKPVKVTDEQGNEYVCIPQTQLDRVTADFNNTVKMKGKEQFSSGYRFGLERLGVQYFGPLEDVPRSDVDSKPREKIKLGSQEFYLDEVISRINGLPTTESIWRK